MKKMKQSHHLVLKSKFPILRLKRNNAIISALLLEIFEKFQVKIYNNSLNSNHIHLLIKAQTQTDLQNFVRVLAGQIAQRITGAVRGKKNKVGFWLKSAWKRMVYWGRDFSNLQKYIFRNQLEVLGLVPYRPRIPKPGP
jgi:REP element-mobilizing transposase RayT